MWSRLFRSSTLALAFSVACSASSSGEAPGGDTGPDDTDPPPAGSGGAGSGGGGGIGIDEGCHPPCASSEICSANKTCIPEGTCAVDGDCAEGLECDAATSTCVPGGECGAHEISGLPVAPNLLIALDRSCSMLHKDKWNGAVGAITGMLTQFAGAIRFGLTLFPDAGAADGCSQLAAPVPVGAAKEQPIQALLSAALVLGDPNYPGSPCNTNIDSAIQQASLEPSFADVDRGSYVLLLTDGKQEGCALYGGHAGTVQMIQDLAAKDVKTFVVGFGNGVDAIALNELAAAGGVPAPSVNQYYQADDAAALEAALDQIGAKATGCVFQLDEVPPNPDELYVYFNDVDGVPHDPTHTNGWDYDPATNQVTFYGDACQALEEATISDVDIVFGCPGPVVD